MNKLMQSLNNQTSTENGAPAYRSTLSANLDFFNKIGSMRMQSDQSVLDLFQAACDEDWDTALRIMLWSRDARGGAGERKVFRTMLKLCDSQLAGGSARKVMQVLVDKTVELGRWDDLFVIEYNFDLVMAKISEGITKQDALLFKWLPREKSSKSALAKRIATALGVSSRQYRKMLSGVVTTETLMCAKKWNEINLSHVPSKASTLYQKAFARNCPQYNEWKAGLATGETKINSSVSFPHDILKMSMTDVSSTVVDAAWNALPNYIPEGVSILPIVDVSGSMSCPASAGLSCMDVSISLGAYIASKNTGPFAGGMITFHDSPEFYFMESGSVSTEFENIRNLPWGGSTNFQATYSLILKHALKNKVAQKDMPEYLLCLSDMQFNQAEGYCNQGKTNFEVMQDTFAASGYKMPKLVFWNLNGGTTNVAATADDKNVILVSGFSPSVMKAVLSGKEVTPAMAMMDVIGSDRYKVL